DGQMTLPRRRLTHFMTPMFIGACQHLDPRPAPIRLPIPPRSCPRPGVGPKRAQAPPLLPQDPAAPPEPPNPRAPVSTRPGRRLSTDKSLRTRPVRPALTGWGRGVSPGAGAQVRAATSGRRSGRLARPARSSRLPAWARGLRVVPAAAGAVATKGREVEQALHADNRLAGAGERRRGAQALIADAARRGDAMGGGEVSPRRRGAGQGKRNGKSRGHSGLTCAWPRPDAGELSISAPAGVGAELSLGRPGSDSSPHPPQLPGPPTLLGTALGMWSQARAFPSPPAPKQQALSLQPPPTSEPLTRALSHRPLMEEARPRSSLSLASSASTLSSISNLSTKVGASRGAGECGAAGESGPWLVAWAPPSSDGHSRPRPPAIPLTHFCPLLGPGGASAISRAGRPWGSGSSSGSGARVRRKDVEKRHLLPQRWLLRAVTGWPRGVLRLQLAITQAQLVVSPEDRAWGLGPGAWDGQDSRSDPAGCTPRRLCGQSTLSWEQIRFLTPVPSALATVLLQNTRRPLQASTAVCTPNPDLHSQSLPDLASEAAEQAPRSACSPLQGPPSPPRSRSLQSSFCPQKPTRAVSRVHAFGKRGNALRRDPNLPVHIRGWLHKQDSAGLRLWKRRWFVLSGHCLFYYKGQCPRGMGWAPLPLPQPPSLRTPPDPDLQPLLADSREESVLGSVLLPSYSIRPDGPGAPRGRRFTFTAEHPGMRTYVLAADTLEDLRGWLRALGRASRAEGDDCGRPRSPARPQPGEGPGGPGGPPEGRRREEARRSESPEVARLSSGRGRTGLLPTSPTVDLQSGSQIRRARSPDLFTPLSRPPSPLSLPRPSSAPARRPPPTSGDTAPSARPHTPMSRIDVRPPLDIGPQRQTVSRPPTPHRGPVSEAGGRPPRSPQHWSQEARTQAPSGTSTYLQLPPRPPGTRASMVLLPGPPLDSPFHQSLETDSLLNKLCGQDRLLRRLQEEIDQRQEEKEQLEAALELTRQQMGQTAREVAVPGRAWGRQRLLQDRLVSVRAALCHLTQERERVWDTYSGLEQELGTLRETLEYLLHLGSPQDRASAQQQLWMVEDTLAGLGAPQKPPTHTEPDSPPAALQIEESSERESLPESLELSSSRSPEADWGRPPGGNRDLASPSESLVPPALRAAVPLLPSQEPSPRNTTPYLPTSEGHRERVLSLSHALATEASQWHKMMTGGNVDSRVDTLPPAPPPASDPTPQVTSPPTSPGTANSRPTAFSRPASGRGAAAAWETTWASGPAPPVLAQDEGAWPLRVTLLQSSF
ncbi:Pleckstrin homology domain-containing family A member 4, partial [Galemys pyrenaicus]